MHIVLAQTEYIIHVLLLYYFFVNYRRTGNIFKINARKDSMGFDYIDDYFSDSSKTTCTCNYLRSLGSLSYECDTVTDKMEMN